MKRSLKEVVIDEYRNTFREILSSQFRTNPNLSLKFFSASSDKQQGIDKEIERVSDEMANSLVKKLETKDYLKREPSNLELEHLIVDVLKEFGMTE